MLGSTERKREFSEAGSKTGFVALFFIIPLCTKPKDILEIKLAIRVGRCLKAQSHTCNGPSEEPHTEDNTDRGR